MYKPGHFEATPGALLVAAEHETAREPLDDKDFVWLEPFRGRNIAPEELETTNTLINVGSLDLRKINDPVIREEVIDARRTFFGKWLGWEDETHPMNGAYRVFLNHHKRLGPPGTFVDTQRVLHKAGVDGFHATRLNPVILWKGSNNVKSWTTAMAEQGYTVGKLVKEQPNLLNQPHSKLIWRTSRLLKAGVGISSIEGHALAKPNYFKLCVKHFRENGDKSAYRAEQRVRHLAWVVLAFGYRLDEVEKTADDTDLQARKTTKAQEIARELFDHQPKLRTASDTRLMVQARLLSKFGAPGITPEEINRLTGVPVETQIIALMTDREYTAYNLELLNKAIKDDRRQIVKQMIDSQRPAMEAKLGTKTVLAYERYASRPLAQR